MSPEEIRIKALELAIDYSRGRSLSDDDIIVLADWFQYFIAGESRPVPELGDRGEPVRGMKSL